jgi:hypothetical protein
LLDQECFVDAGLFEVDHVLLTKACAKAGREKTKAISAIEMNLKVTPLVYQLFDPHRHDRKS